MTRTDLHRPAEIDPADYDLVAEGDRGERAEDGDPGYEHWYSPEHANRDHAKIHEPSYSNLVCQHCGHSNLRFYSIFLHRPTGELLLVGDQCATKLALDSRSAVERRKAREENARAAARQRWIDENEDGEEIAAYLEENYLRNEFLASLRSSLRRWGNLSEKQHAAVRKNIERDAERAREREVESANDPDPAPIPEEILGVRSRISGRILGVKFVEGLYGTQEKMLVLDDRGFKLWGTRPSSLLVEAPRELKFADEAQKDAARFGGWIEYDGVFYRPADRGDRVAFDAKVERSEKDADFGFFSRPTKAEAEAGPYAADVVERFDSEGPRAETAPHAPRGEGR